MKHLFDGRAAPALSGVALSLYAALGAMPSTATADTTTWTTCSTEGQTCSFSGTRQVRFGANGVYAVRTATSSIACNNSVFGDPVYGVSKTCAYATTVASAPAADPTTSPGAGVFLDANLGDDGNPGTFAKPWKTLAKLASAKVASGAGVYLKCGTTFRGTLNLGPNQLQNGSLVAGYGNCSTNKAVISGADDFSDGWTVSGNIWQRRIPVGTPKIAQVFVNGVPHRIAQWPNFGGIGKEYAIADSASPASSTVLKAKAADASKLAGKDITGATLIVRDQPYFLDQRTVSSYNAGAGLFTLDSATTGGMEGGDGYVLQNKKWMLDAPGEFYHDQANGVLYVYPATSVSAINNYVVEGTVRAQAVQISNRSKLTISNIAAVKTKTVGMLLSDAPAAIVESVSVSDNATAGLRVIYNAAGTVIRNSKFERNAYSAIDSMSVSGVTISNNQVIDTGTVAYAGTTTTAVNNGPSGVISGNTFKRSAYAAIGFSGTGGSKVTNNVIEDTCVRFTDGAGIYTWNGMNNTVNQSSLVEGNVIARVVGNSEGAVGGGDDSCSGVMLDDLARSVTIRGNTIIGARMGIYLHNASYTTVESNKVWLAERTAMFINMDRTNQDVSVGNVVRNNQFNTAVAYTGTYPAVPYFNTDYNAIWFWHAIGGVKAIRSGSNSFSGNELLMLNGDSAMGAAIRGGGSGITTSMTSSEWRKLNTAEAAPRLASQFTPYTATFGQELIANGDFLSGMSGWSSWFASSASKGSVSVTSATGCTSSCALFSAGTIYDVLASPSFSMNNGGLYRLKFNAAFMADGTLGAPRVSNGSSLSSYVNLSDTASQTLNYDGFYSATSNSGSINLSAAAGTRVGYDSVSVKQVTGYTLAKPSDWASFDYAYPTTTKTVTCATLGWPNGCTVTDGNGVAVGLPTTLAAGTAKLFLRRDTPLRVK